MFFLFRCAFFLAIVFYYLPWPEGSFSALTNAPSLKGDVKGAVANAAGEIGQAAAQAALREVESACRKNPDRCAQYAGHLAQMIHHDEPQGSASLAKYPLGPGLGEPSKVASGGRTTDFDHWSLRLRD